MTQDLVGKNYIVTGSNTGIGKVTALELARRGARVIMACRSLEKAQPVADEIRRETGNVAVEVVALDLSSQASVRHCTETLARDLPIHGLINNAGITAGLRGANTVTADGFEPTFGTNHLGHYLLTRLLLDRIKQTPGGSRIVNVSSHSHYMAKKIDWEMFRRAPSRTGLAEYEASKLCNVLFTKELAKRLAGTGVTAYAVHPGQVATDIWRRLPGPTRWLFKKIMFMLTPEEGAVSSLHCATSPAVAGESGLYYDEKGKPKYPSRIAQNPDLATELWVKSAAWAQLPLD